VTTTKHYVTIWSICVLHGSALTYIRSDRQCVYLAYFYSLDYQCAKNY